MKRFGVWVALALFVCLTQLSRTAFAQTDVSCDCEALACGACETETDTTFYSAKCGPGNARVKSCKKPTCVAVENQSACLAKLKGGADLQSTQARANQKHKSANGDGGLVTIGKVFKHSGVVRLLRADGRVEAVSDDTSIFKGDTIETKANGSVHLVLLDKAQVNGKKPDGTELVLPANSRLRIDEANLQPAKDSRKVALNLLAGKLRSHVTSKYIGENTFQVKAGAAVAGVRGTDFITAFEPSETNWKTQVMTIEGSVNLAAEESKPGAPPIAVDIPAGKYAAYFVASPPSGSDSEEISRISASGRIGDAAQIDDAELRLLKATMELELISDEPAKKKKDANVVHSTDEEIVCTAPSGQFNQCSYTCEGNPKNEKTCRTDMKGVTCMRRLCRANGKWEEEHAMPANQADLCDPHQIKARDCGQYW